MRSSLKPEQPKRNRKLFQKKKRFIGPIDKESNQCAPNFNIFHNLVKTRFIPPIPRFRIAYIFFYLWEASIHRFLWICTGFKHWKRRTSTRENLYAKTKSKTTTLALEKGARWYSRKRNIYDSWLVSKVGFSLRIHGSNLESNQVDTLWHVPTLGRPASTGATRPRQASLLGMHIIITPSQCQSLPIEPAPSE